MASTFKAKIYKVGINPCVRVPQKITKTMKPIRGYIPVRGKINRHSFQQTLVPVKNEGYRLYVNGSMMKGADVRVGQTATFAIAQNKRPGRKLPPMPAEFKKQLEGHNVFSEFKKLIPSRQKEILRYLNNLKSEESLLRNIDKVIKGLRKIEAAPLFRL